MKKEYTEPDMQILVFSIEDVITVSGGSGPIELPDLDWYNTV